MDRIIGKSCTRKEYSEAFIGAASLESLKVMEYQMDRAVDAIQMAPRMSLSFLLFFFIVVTSLYDIFISLYDKYIT